MRGFILQMMMTHEHLGRVWPIVANSSTKMASFYSINQNFGMTAIFNKTRDVIDIGANKNKCYNILPELICGKKTNVNTNEKKKEILERSVD